MENSWKPPLISWLLTTSNFFICENGGNTSFDWNIYFRAFETRGEFSVFVSKRSLVCTWNLIFRWSLLLYWNTNLFKFGRALFFSAQREACGFYQRFFFHSMNLVNKMKHDDIYLFVKCLMIVIFRIQKVSQKNRRFRGSLIRPGRIISLIISKSN